jgi:magnesium chelatase family protein
MVGLPDTTVRESRESSARRDPQLGIRVPASPHHRQSGAADVRKAGSSFDLPIALGLLATSGH